MILILLLCLNLVQSAIIDKPDFDRHEDLTVNRIRYQKELSKEYHLKKGEEFVEQQLRKKAELNSNVAKNIILFLGDGMSISTLTAARIYTYQEEGYLPFEKLPHVAMSKTYCVDQQVADSACSATAYLCGIKNNLGTIGVNAKVSRASCTQANDKTTHVKSIAQWALDSGKSIGLVTTTTVTHASPAGVYAHISERDWESNSDIQNSKCDDTLIDDIAEQLVFGETGSKLNVIFGGGRQNFIDQSVRDEFGYKGKRTDGKNLIKEWLNFTTSGEKRSYVWNKAGLLSIKPSANESYLGLFAPSHCDYNYKVDGISDTSPTLSEMTMKAIEILQTNKNGFFLFVEGGRIDHALHDNQAHIALEETAEFARAFKLAANMLSFNNTLFVVTADHSHTMTLSGYAARGSNIFGIGGRSDRDSKPYLKLSFANGPGYHTHKNSDTTRIDPIKSFNVNDFELESPATIPRKQETHGGDDVPIYSNGPYSHLFSGSMEQNTIPHIMAFASCIGDGITACNFNEYGTSPK